MTLPEPRREAALQQLRAFLPRAGSHYANERNADTGPGPRQNVSLLSPHLRSRLLTEAEVVAAVLDRYAFTSAEKFIQEVCWRTYWKGWLEQRPAIWRRYETELAALQQAVGEGSAADRPLRRRWRAAVAGETGIGCFDAWAQELVATGYLHNHTRMWFASIWIFTLRLPWQLGAAFFLEHLLDGDAASNTLSWRWVAGLQTRGKHYLARADNIQKYTANRWWPRGELNEDAEPLPADDIPGAQPLAALAPLPRGPRTALWLHDEDLHPESLWPGGIDGLVAIGGAVAPREAAEPVRAFADGALADGLSRAATHFGVEARALAPAERWRWLRDQRIEQLVTPWATVGPGRDALDALERELAAEDIRLVRVRRAWDEAFWPHANRGFFQLRERIRPVLRELGLP